jgi:hypothetical protein
MTEKQSLTDFMASLPDLSGPPLTPSQEANVAQIKKRIAAVAEESTPRIQRDLADIAAVPVSLISPEAVAAFALELRRCFERLAAMLKKDQLDRIHTK